MAFNRRLLVISLYLYTARERMSLSIDPRHHRAARRLSLIALNIAYSRSLLTRQTCLYISIGLLEGQPIALTSFDVILAIDLKPLSLRVHFLCVEFYRRQS